jgi:hypothetical protein
MAADSWGTACAQARELKKHASTLVSSIEFDIAGRV